MELPHYAGPLLQLQPPFYFKNVTSCLFPLRAQLNALQRFCDSYLNIIPEELGHFRAAVPYVYLILLDYGQMAAKAANTGWIAQREVVFCVPVEWYKRVHGRLLFHDWASVAPFIYVDDEISLTLGRTALGWPKSLVRLTPQLTGFLKDPSGSTTDVALSAQVLPKAYAGAELVERVVMEVRSPMYSSWQVPFDPASPLAPWTLWSDLARSASGFGLDAFGMLQGSGILPALETGSPENWARKSARAFELANQCLPWALNLTSNTVNLKQFRRADEPRDYCYQALVNGPMRFTSFNRGALLGRLGADSSGGYAIDITCWPTFPMVDALGLQAEITTPIEGPRVARLRPVMPFWYDVDMTYDRAETIAWRTEDGQWRDGSGHVHAVPGRTPSLEFNTTMGAASPVVTGPFHFPAARFTVLPLLAHAAPLRDMLERNLNEPLAGSEHFELWGADPDGYAYVYMIVKDRGEVASDTNSIGDWAEMCVTLYVPVKRAQAGEAAQGGLFAVQAFAQGTTQACTLSELYGIPAMEAMFVAPPTAVDHTYRPEPCSLLCVNAETLPAIGLGQEARNANVLELIDRGDRAHVANAPLSQHAELFCRALRVETARKWQLPDGAKQLGRVRALELLTLERPLHVYTLKQFRDAVEPQRACYQALVRIPHVLREVQQIQEITRLISVQIQEYPALQLVRRLGLVARETSLVEGRTVHTLDAVRPFWIEAGLELKNGERLQYRAGMRWMAVPGVPEREIPRLTPELEEVLCRSYHRELKRGVQDFLETVPPPPAAPREAQPWIEQIDPQAVIESILSREWEDRSSSSTRQTTRDTLTRRMQRDEAGWGSWLEDNLRWLAGLRHAGADAPVHAQELAPLQLSAADSDTVRWLRHWEHLSLLLDQEGDSSALADSTLEHAWQMWSEGDWLAAVASGAAPGAFRSLDSSELAAVRAECAALADRYTRADLAQQAVRRTCARLVRRLLQLLYPEAERRLEDALDAAVDRLRRPDHCVQRALAGRERDRLFPLEHSWDHCWFHGLSRAELELRMQRG